jgi:glycosyltransferase involved in cell wall biosynthesis
MLANTGDVHWCDRPLKIDVVVHGRFFAFGLARALLGLGHDVVVHTNYPGFIVRRFGIPAANVRSFAAHGIKSRIAGRLRPYVPKNTVDSMLHQSFGRWAAHSVRHDADVIHGFSGVMEETLRSPRTWSQQLRTVVRGSAHIREQSRLLIEEEERAGTFVDRPSEWIINREEREYELADKIIVLSTFAHESFVSRGVPLNRLELCRPGVDLSHFRATKPVLEERLKRVVGGTPLRVLTTGTFSFQKGARYLAEVATTLSQRMLFRFVGDVSAEAAHFARRSSPHIEFFGRVPEKSLVHHYAWADVFFFPTIQDGFAMVLLQAAAGGLPIVASTNCAATDLVLDGETGWICPIRDTDGFIQRLSWCDENRDAMARTIRKVAWSSAELGWPRAAAELVSIFARAMTQRGCSPA